MAMRATLPSPALTSSAPAAIAFTGSTVAPVVVAGNTDAPLVGVADDFVYAIGSVNTHNDAQP